jgi:O-antigen/teichoic acid export membrane protein
MSNIRVTYTGLIAFLTSIIGVITGTVFVIIVTRTIPPDEFGLWTLVGSLVSYVLVVEPIISYWTTRQTSRDENVGRTALASSSVLSLGGIAAYLVIALLVHIDSQADLSFLLLATVLVPLFFITNTSTSICAGFKPQSISYATILFETMKIPLGILFVIVLEWGVYGALYTSIFALSFKMIFLVYSSREKLLSEIKKSYIKFWAKMSWMPLYFSSSGLVTKLDILIYTTFTGSLLGPAYWGVSIAVSSLVGHSFNISHGLYPKLLADSKTAIAEANLQRTMFFAIPLLAVSIIFAKPMLHILNPIYVDAVMIVYLLSLRGFVGVPLGIFYNILSAYEKIDTNKNVKFTEMLHSKLFLIPTLQHIQSGFYIVTLVVLFIMLQQQNASEIELVTYWAFSQLITLLPFLFYSYYKVKKETNFKINFQILFKFLLVTIFASIIAFYLSEIFLTYPQSIYDHLPELIPIVILSGSLYFGILYVVDTSTRLFFNSILSEIRK